MATLTTLRTRIEELYPQAAEASSTIKNRFLNDAYCKLFGATDNTKRYSATSVASQLEYILPADFIALKEITWDGDPLAEAPVSWLQRYDEDWRTTTGTPEYYNVEGDRLRIVPVDAAGSHAIAISYFGAPTALSDDADTPDVPSPYDDLFCFGACHLIALRLKDWDTAARFKALWDEGFRAARRELGKPNRARSEQVEDVYGW